MRLAKRIRERLVRLMLPKLARVTFAPLPDSVLPPEHRYAEPPEEIMDPDFLFGGFTINPNYNRLSLTFGNSTDCPAGRKARMKEAKKTAKANAKAYGDITERRDVFFEKAEIRKDGTAVFPLSTVQ